MNLEEDILIERFLKKQLTNEEEKTFLERLRTDIDFNKKFVFEKQLFQTLNEDEWSFAKNIDQKELDKYKELYNGNKSKNLKRILKNVNADYQNNSKKKLNKKLLYYISAAVFVILITVFSISNLKKSSQDLYANYFNELDLPSLITRGNSTSNLAKAQQFFEVKEYVKAVSIFKTELQNTNKQRATLYLYTGISLTELNKYDEAKQIFDKLINSDLLEASKGLWYKALLYLKMNDIANAKITLQKITSDSTNFNFKEAEELLTKI